MIFIAFYSLLLRAQTISWVGAFTRLLGKANPLNFENNIIHDVNNEQ